MGENWIVTYSNGSTCEIRCAPGEDVNRLAEIARPLAATVASIKRRV